MRQSGFTLIELIAITVIVGILAVVALPRFFDQTIFDSRAFADQTQSMLRYAQKVAIAQNRNVFVQLNGSRIALCFTAVAANADCAANNQVVAAAGRNSGKDYTVTACGAANAAWFCEAPPTGIAYATDLGVTLFYFNALGKPINSTNSPDADLPRLTITITGDGGTRLIFVEQETGYVHS